MKGIIIENISNLYKVKTFENNEIYEANARGKFKKEQITPVVGDKVEISIVDEKDKKAIIEKIEDREIYIKRPKLANMTQIVFVVSSKDPKPDLLMLDKQLAFAEYLGLKVIIVLNKTDLDKKQNFKDIRAIYEKIGYNVVETNSKERIGIDELIKLLKGNINGFSGNSGVGKSSLINAIFNKDVTQEGEVSKKNKRGKNTTTAINLYEIDKNTFIADTPGFSTFDISEIKSKNLCNYFKEFKKYIKDCEFIGCTHIKEENCGIRKALESGEISQNRYNNFIKIYLDLKDKEEHKW